MRASVLFNFDSTTYSVTCQNRNGANVRQTGPNNSSHVHFKHRTQLIYYEMLHWHLMKTPFVPNEVGRPVTLATPAWHWGEGAGL